jgi:hypothetical protein
MISDLRIGANSHPNGTRDNEKSGEKDGNVSN